MLDARMPVSRAWFVMRASLGAASRDGCNIFFREAQLAENRLKTRRVLRISFLRAWGLRKGVAQRRRGRAVHAQGEYGFRAVLLQARGSVQRFKLSVRECKEHAVASRAGHRFERGTSTDTQPKVVDTRRTRILRRDAAGTEDFGIHEQAIEEGVDAAYGHLHY